MTSGAECIAVLRVKYPAWDISVWSPFSITASCRESFQCFTMLGTRTSISSSVSAHYLMTQFPLTFGKHKTREDKHRSEALLMSVSKASRPSFSVIFLFMLWAEFGCKYFGLKSQLLEKHKTPANCNVTHAHICISVFVDWPLNLNAINESWNNTFFLAFLENGGLNLGKDNWWSIIQHRHGLSGNLKYPAVWMSKIAKTLNDGV